MSLYAADKSHFVADAGARLFRVSAYYAAKTIAALPFMACNVAVGAALLYGMAGLRPELGAVAVNFCACGLLYLVAQQVCGLATIVTPNQVRGRCFCFRGGEAVCCVAAVRALLATRNKTNQPTNQRTNQPTNYKPKTNQPTKTNQKTTKT
jgi:hypothetical protein